MDLQYIKTYLSVSHSL